MDETKNVIILTTGLAGSSVLAGLLATAGYWAGSSTAKKEDYDTYENNELVEMNRRILEESNYDGNFTMVFSRRDFEQIEAAGPQLDSRPYADFIRKCEEHRPWIWKDPRLWLTMRFWAPLLDLESVRFVLLSREPLQSWISTTLRRQIQTYRHSRDYSNGILGSILEFLDERSLEHLHIVYEDLICRPEATLERLNGYLDSSITLDDLKRVYSGKLYRKTKGTRDLLKACLIHLRNYRERYR